MKNRRFISLWSVAIAACGLAVSAWMQPAFAQKSGGTSAKPRISFSIVSHGEALPFINEHGKNSASLNNGDTVPTLLMRERSISLFQRDTAFQTGSVAINRIGGDTEGLLVAAYSMEYLDSALRPLPNLGLTTIQLPVPLPVGAVVSNTAFPAPLAVGINGLQGDLSPTMANANGQLAAVQAASRSLPNTANIQPGQRRVLLNFTARWSDQSLSPRTAGLQGRRYVRLTLLRVNDFNYEVGVTLATVILDDPLRVGPVIANAIQDKQMQRGATDLIELETPGFRGDGQVNTVFYDQNYNVLTYTARSSDSTLVSAVTRQNDARVGGRPSLFYAVQPGAPAGATVTITVTANDGTGLSAQDSFIINIVNSVTSVANAPEVNMTISPNPSADRINIESVAKQSGRVRVRISNALGTEVLSEEIPVTLGSQYRHTVDVSAFPTGVYMVEIQDGAARSVRKIVKN